MPCRIGLVYQAVAMLWTTSVMCWRKTEEVMNSMLFLFVVIFLKLLRLREDMYLKDNGVQVQLYDKKM